MCIAPSHFPESPQVKIPLLAVGHSKQVSWLAWNGLLIDASAIMQKSCSLTVRLSVAFEKWHLSMGRVRSSGVRAQWICMIGNVKQG